VKAVHSSNNATGSFFIDTPAGTRANSDL